MSQQRQYNDTTFTKLFVGGLAWETQRETMRLYFEQFGEILEAVVITDKNTGRSKGYGFVTFKEPEAAMRACHNPSPVIDGRRANCNLASFGAQKNHPTTSTPQQVAGPVGRFRPSSSVYHGGASSPPYIPRPAHYSLPYSSYGYPGYSQDPLYPLSYNFNSYGSQQISPYYYPPTGAHHGMFHGFYPFYAQYAQSSSQGQAFGVQYPPQMLHQYPYLPPPPPPQQQQQFSSTAILSRPSSAPPGSGVVISTPATNAPMSTMPMTTEETTTTTPATATATTTRRALQDASAEKTSAPSQQQQQQQQ